MGFLSSIRDTLFGDEGKGQSKAQAKENEANRVFIREATTQARSDIDRLFPGVQATRLQGFQGAADIFQQTVPQQLQAFQGGNIAAQQTTAGAPLQIQNALLGLPVDLNALQAQQPQQFDTSFLSQPLPQIPQPQAPPQPQIGNPLAGFFGGQRSGIFGQNFRNIR